MNNKKGRVFYPFLFYRIFIIIFVTMRIKKKYVLLESLLIDVSSEFSDNEKRILKLIHKKYNKERENYNYSLYDVAAWLIEDFDLSYEDAFELSKSYFWEGRRLFSEYEPLRKKWPIAEIFFNKLGEFSGEFAKSFPNDIYGTLEVKIKDDEGFNDVRDVRIWGGFNSLSFYLNFPFYRIYDGFRSTYIGGESSDARLIRVDIDFKLLDNDGNTIDAPRWRTEEYESGSINLNEFLVSVNYRIGSGSSLESKNLMEFKVPFPKPLTKQSVMDIFKKLTEDVIQKIQTTTFELPAGTEPIVVSAGSQLD